jgi:hypothetical protein
MNVWQRTEKGEMRHQWTQQLLRRRQLRPCQNGGTPGYGLSSEQGDKPPLRAQP